jgi:hypothetical protein
MAATLKRTIFIIAAKQKGRLFACLVPIGTNDLLSHQDPARKPLHVNPRQRRKLLGCPSESIYHPKEGRLWFEASSSHYRQSGQAVEKVLAA